MFKLFNECQAFYECLQTSNECKSFQMEVRLTFQLIAAETFQINFSNESSTYRIDVQFY